MADYSSPKPIDPLWYRRDCFINAACTCGRRVSLDLGALIRKHRLDENQSLYQLIDRLKCSSCGNRPSACDVTARPRNRPIPGQ